jgi:hypothetical protein
VADDIEKQTGISAEPAVPASNPDASADKLIDLPPGTDLTPDLGVAVTAAALTRLVLIAGEAESGKTTLLATIYEKFNGGPFAKLLFAGSQTLISWEERCHLARVASGGERPDTERTLGLQQRLLHLRVRDVAQDQPIQDLLFTDLSGEVFKLVRDSTAECQQLGMLKRADHIVLLLDGEKLANAASRHEALNNGLALLRSCVDARMIGSHSFVDVVFSKYDLLTAGAGAIEFLQFAEERISSRFGSRVGRLRFHNIAARPGQASGVEFGFGISDLLRSWVDDSPYFMPNLAYALGFPPNITEFDNYLRVRYPALSEIRAWK